MSIGLFRSLSIPGIAKKRGATLRPALNLNFVAGTLPSGVTFSRASNATQFDSLGRLVWAPANLCLRSNDWTAGWSTAVGDTAYTPNYGLTPNGRASTLITFPTPSPVGGGDYNNQACIVGAEHVLQVKVRVNNWTWARVALLSTSTTANQIHIWINLDTRTAGVSNATGTATLRSATVTPLSGGWCLITLIGMVPFSSATDAAIILVTATANNSIIRQGNGAAIEVGEVVLKPYDASTGDLFLNNSFDTTGSAYYGPRFDFSPQTLAARGLLIEEQRTNNSLRSDGIGSISATNALAPTPLLGWVGSRRLTGDGTLNNHAGTADAFVNAASTVYTVSVFAKYVDTQFIQLANTINGSLATGYANFDLINGTVTATGAAATGTITNCGGGVYRCTMTFTSIAAPASGVSIVLYLCSTGTDTRAPVNTLATSVDFFGMQHEAGAFATSLIPTFGTAATRAADVASVLSLGWFTQGVGTFLLEGVYPDTNASTRLLFDVNDGSAVNRYYIRYNATRSVQGSSTISSVLNTATTANTLGVLTASKMALAFSVAGKSTCLNGGTVASNATAGPASGMVALYLGASITGGSNANGWISKLNYYNTRLPDATLQALTA